MLINSFFDEIEKISRKSSSTNEMGIGIDYAPVSHEIEYDDDTEERHRGWKKTKGPHDYYVRGQLGNKVYNISLNPPRKNKTKIKPYKKFKFVLGRGERGWRDESG